MNGTCTSYTCLIASNFGKVPVASTAVTGMIMMVMITLQTILPGMLIV